MWYDSFELKCLEAIIFLDYTTNARFNFSAGFNENILL